MVLKTTGTILRFQSKNRFLNGTNIARDIFYNLFLADGLVWLTKSKYISGIALFFKHFFLSLKPWDRAGFFENHESYILRNNFFWPFTSKIWADGVKLIFIEYLWALKRWNQLKYPIHQSLCYTVLYCQAQFLFSSSQQFSWTES